MEPSVDEVKTFEHSVGVTVGDVAIQPTLSSSSSLQSTASKAVIYAIRAPADAYQSIRKTRQRIWRLITSNIHERLNPRTCVSLP